MFGTTMAAALLLVAPAAGGAKAAELDGELLACCAEATAIRLEGDRLWDACPADADGDHPAWSAYYAHTDATVPGEGWEGGGSMSGRKPAQVGNVVPIRAPKQSAAAIARDVQARREAIDREVLSQLVELNAALRERMERTRAEAPVIARAMRDYQTLLDWLQVGREMAGQGGRP